MSRERGASGWRETAGAPRLESEKPSVSYPDARRAILRRKAGYVTASILTQALAYDLHVA